VDPLERLRLLELATAELLESETNASLTLGAEGHPGGPMVVTALGCSVVVAIGLCAAVLMPLASPGRRRSSGARALAAGCDRTLRTVHRLPLDFVPSVAFNDPTNTAGWLDRLG
jgi:hypothetical protein